MRRRADEPHQEFGPTAPGPRPLRRLTRRWTSRPRPTLRLRLAALYGSLFLVCGMALVGTTYVLVDHATSSAVFLQGKDGQTFFFGNSSDHVVALATTDGGRAVSGSIIRAGTLPHGAPSGSVVFSGGSAATSRGSAGSAAGRTGAGSHLPIPVPGVLPGKAPTPRQAEAQFDLLRAQAVGQHSAEMHQLLLWSLVALAFATLLSALLGWLLAGRALRPLTIMTSTARDISSTNLRKRITLTGPDDELKELGDTFDALLERLERSFEAQRQFVANASHELRTPLARQRTMLEVALDDPSASVASLRTVAKAVLAAEAEQERLVEALLTLATSERGLEDRHPLDLGSLLTRVLSSRAGDAAAKGIDLRREIGPARVLGSEHLVVRLMANLVDNAIRYNVSGGWVLSSTALDGKHGVLRIANSGPVVPASEVDRLLRPFERADDVRTRKEGHGIGLSIVAAVADAHDATIVVLAPEAGGLDVTVSFPAAPPVSVNVESGDRSADARSVERDASGDVLAGR